MSTPSTIAFVRRSDLDVAKWDACIDTAFNGLIYAYSWYLDHMSERWDALVKMDGDRYEAVMPLTWNRKYGVYYLFQPFLCAQLGMFGKKITESVVMEFLQQVPSRFRYWDIYLNHHNLIQLPAGKLKGMAYLRRNFVLPLNQPYAELQAGYRDSIKRNIRKAEQVGCTVVKDFPVDQVIALATDQMAGRDEAVNENVKRFERLYAFLHERSAAITYGIQNNRGALVASCVFIFSHNRAYYILVGNHPDGRTMGASHALIDAFIRDHAGRDILLDFEGSDIRNLAFFYSSFGALEENFGAIRVNRLPLLLRWMKK